MKTELLADRCGSIYPEHPRVRWNLGTSRLLRETGAGTNRRDAFEGVPVYSSTRRRRSGQRRFTVLHCKRHHVVLRRRRQRVVLRLKPYKFGFQITYTLLKAPHLRDHPGVGTADVA